MVHSQCVEVLEALELVQQEPMVDELVVVVGNCLTLAI
jgi:hypothetical protein